MADNVRENTNVEHHTSHTDRLYSWAAYDMDRNQRGIGLRRYVWHLLVSAMGRSVKLKGQNMIREELHAEARQQVDRLKTLGVVFDKKQLRFNDIVETAIRYGRCSAVFDPAAARRGLVEAISACIPNDPMYVEKPNPMYVEKSNPITIVPDWMLSAPELAN